MEDRQTNYTISEGYELPSRGLIYDKQVDSHVELRSMTARDEMKRCAPTTAQFKLLSDLIEGCLIEKPAVHVYDMALGDYEFLLHKLRVVTYGDEYAVTLKSPYCGESFDSEIHLDDLTVKEFDLDKFNELREFTLPVSKNLIKLKFQTPRMLDEAEALVKEMKRKYKDAEIDFSLMVTLQQLIDTVDGNKLKAVELESFINKLPAKDMMKILNNIDKMNAVIGLDNKVSVTCPSCGGEVTTYFRFGQEFFRPTNI